MLFLVNAVLLCVLVYTLIQAKKLSFYISYISDTSQEGKVAEEQEDKVNKELEQSINDKKHNQRLMIFSLLALAVCLHLLFCEWHFDDTTTGAYCIIAFSEKPNPVQIPERADLYKIVNGLFARNNLPLIGQITEKNKSMIWRNVGIAPSPNDFPWVLSATILGIFIPVALLLFAIIVFCYSLKDIQ